MQFPRKPELILILFLKTATSLTFSSDLVGVVHERASVERRSRETRETRAACLYHLAHFSLDRRRKKRDYS